MSQSKDQAVRQHEPIPCLHGSRKPQSHVYDKIMKVIVGPNGAEKEYQIYRGRLCYVSDYFDRLLNGTFIEGGSESLRLANVDIDVFQSFFFWIICGMVDCTIGSTNLSTLDFWSRLINIYTFADYYQAPAFKNAILDYLYLIVEARKDFPLDTMPLLYANTTEHDPLRKLAVDIWAASCSLSGLDKSLLDRDEREFLWDYIMACKEKQIVPGAMGFKRSVWQADMRSHFCERYHEHMSNVRAPLTSGEPDKLCESLGVL